MRLRHTWIIGALILAGCGDSIHDLVNREDLAQIEALLAKNPRQVNARTPLGKTPLHYAVTYGKPELIEFLVSKGADVDAADDTGLTPLHVAAMLGRVKEADLLLKLGADIEARDEFGDTPLHTAALFGQSATLELLAGAGANLHTTNNDNATPMDAALKSRREEAVATIERIEKQGH